MSYNCIGRRGEEELREVMEIKKNLKVELEGQEEGYDSESFEDEEEDRESEEDEEEEGSDD